MPITKYGEQENAVLDAQQAEDQTSGKEPKVVDEPEESAEAEEVEAESV